MYGDLNPLPDVTKDMVEEVVAYIDVMEDLNTFKVTIVLRKIVTLGVSLMRVEEE